MAVLFRIFRNHGIHTDFSSLKLDKKAEKPDLNTGVVNGGYFMFNREFLEYTTDDDGEMLESDALQRLTKDGQLNYYLHKGFWRGMDTYREYVELNGLWDEGTAPWRVW